MKWKIFITAFTSTLLINFPANIWGCGGWVDPYDNYISFFHQELPDAKGYHPFYYSNYNFLYDTQEPANAVDVLSQEWADYCGSPVTAGDAEDFVFAFSAEHIDSLLTVTQGKKFYRKKPATLEANSMSNYFLLHKDLQALQYISYAKHVQPYVIGDPAEWESLTRDSVGMDSLIKVGQQLLSKTKNDFIKLKYGYQLVRLAHYSNRYSDAIMWYDEYIAGNKTKSILQPMSMSLKAGALYKSGREKEAALLFSKAFCASEVKRVSNFYGFSWSRQMSDTMEAYLAYCKTAEERTSLLILFALSASDCQLPALKEIYDLDPQNAALEVIAVREINKLEEKYLTPVINSKRGGNDFDDYYTSRGADTSAVDGENIDSLAEFLHKAAQKNNVSNPGLFEISAAYLKLIRQDYVRARTYLDDAMKMNLEPKLKDQWELTNILLKINSADSIDAAFESAILPSIKWLQQKAQNDTVIKTPDYWEISPWRKFYRDIMSQVIAKKYDAQGDIYKEALAIGSSERIFENSSHDNYSGSVIFLHNNLESKDVMKLYELLNSNKRTAYENYLTGFNNIRKNDLVDFIGTVYLREYNYEEAIKWFKRTDTIDYQISVNPFIDILYDKVWPREGETFSTTKLAFATEMLRLEKLATKDKKNAAKYYYKMALGLYNMTYYGRAWELVQYDRSSYEGYSLEDDEKRQKMTSTAFKKEYYNCYKAHDYFKKAMDASTDKNFKARCLFMMAKSYQKSVEGNEDFYESKYFPQLVKEYGNTASYKEAFNSCSYLRDFVAGK